MDDFEKRWTRIQDQLRIQMNGDEQPRVTSGRTLFGIPSAGEQAMERFARQIDDENLARLRRGGDAEESEDDGSPLSS